MIQGCGSDVGKSILTAGLCRVFANRGLRVSPFKPQNMSNNAAVTPDGGEIGRAQALQAAACRIPPSVLMNPVLLKPQSDVDAQVIVRGRVAGSFSARRYEDRKPSLLDVVVESFHELRAASDLVLVEGAGSPAEINLRDRDIANMGFARATNTPVILVGDIDRGHVIAALVGAHAVLDAADRAMIQGFIINKFRGDPRLFDGGRKAIVERTGWRDFGMVNWQPCIAKLPEEDALAKHPRKAEAQVRIVVPMLSRIANADEFDALRAEDAVDFAFIPPGRPLPGDADLVILPGTKSTIADLAFLRRQGWDIDLAAHIRRGGRVLGICGGYQLLGRSIADPGGVEGEAGAAEGLGHLDVETVLTGDKVLTHVSGRLTQGHVLFEGYEMHMGRTAGSGTERPFLIFQSGTPDGAFSADRRICGCYVHGLFARPEPRAALLSMFGASSNGLDQRAVVDAALEELAHALELSLDIEGLTRAAGLA
jgi:adenosylcobyric acid synthase